MARDIKGRLQRWQKVIESIRQDEESFAIFGLDRVGEAAKTALKGESLSQAFRRLGLDAQKPHHIDLLCAALADIVFGRGKAGRKLGKASKGSWNSARLLNVALDYKKLQDEQPGISDTEAAEKLKAHGQSADAVRRQLPKARAHLAQVEQYFASRSQMDPRRAAVQCGVGE
jgi:hypothetical protein